MKQMYGIGVMLYALMLCLGLSSCSSDDENGGSISMSQLVGSEWKRSYTWVDMDNGAWEEGEGVLKFTSSSRAEEEVKYHGEDWKYNYDLDCEEYKPYSGTSFSFYTYQVSDGKIILRDEEYGNTITATLSGNRLTGGDDYQWTLVKAGSGDEGSGDSQDSYSWADMQGVWMEELYDAYAAEISVYKSQNSSSEVYLNNAYNGNFRVFGIQFNASGSRKELDVQMKAFHNDNALVLQTIYTSDGKTLYWTDVENDSYRGSYIIRGNEIYYNGNVVYNILYPNMITDQANNVYVKVK